MILAIRKYTNYRWRVPLFDEWPKLSGRLSAVDDSP
jgi:small nuclear ribonucleoprotein (snRNP)-like protein